MSTLREALSSLPGAVFADLLESDEAYLLVIDLPGATAETTEVRLSGNRVTIEARREKEVPAGFDFRRENRSLFLDAELPLPPDAVGTDATAEFNRGVLELRLPKRSSSVGREIPIEEV